MLKWFAGFDPRPRSTPPAPWSNDPMSNRQLLKRLWEDYDIICRVLRIMRLVWLLTFIWGAAGWLT